MAGEHREEVAVVVAEQDTGLGIVLVQFHCIESEVSKIEGFSWALSWLLETFPDV